MHTYKVGDYIKTQTACPKCHKPYVAWLRIVRDEQFGQAKVTINPMCGDCETELFASTASIDRQRVEARWESCQAEKVMDEQMLICKDCAYNIGVIFSPITGQTYCNFCYNYKLLLGVISRSKYYALRAARELLDKRNEEAEP